MGKKTYFLTKLPEKKSFMYVGFNIHLSLLKKFMQENYLSTHDTVNLRQARLKPTLHGEFFSQPEQAGKTRRSPSRCLM